MQDCCDVDFSKYFRSRSSRVARFRSCCESFLMFCVEKGGKTWKSPRVVYIVPYEARVASASKLRMLLFFVVVLSCTNCRDKEEERGKKDLRFAKTLNAFARNRIPAHVNTRVKPPMIQK